MNNLPMAVVFEVLQESLSLGPFLSFLSKFVLDSRKDENRLLNEEIVTMEGM